MRRITALSVVFLVSSLSSGPTFAVTIDVTGSPGIDGGAGIAGNPGTSGGNGGAGQSIAPTNGGISEPLTSVIATGGRGGSGGAGGPGVGAGAAGGSGGVGGAGGAASAEVVVTHPEATQGGASAYGGAGGIGGTGGAAGPSGVMGLGGVGGAGGAASATSIMTQSGPWPGLDPARVTANSFAAGGKGGDALGPGGIGGAGGTATASASVSAESTVLPLPFAEALVYQFGGNGGDGASHAGAGADSAIANAAHASAAGEVSLVEYAQAGHGGQGPGSRGGLANVALNVGHVETDILGLGVSSTGGNASSPSASDPAVGGSARAEASVVDTAPPADVSITIEAYGGDAKGPNAQGGTAALSALLNVPGAHSAAIFAQAGGGDGELGVSLALDNAVNAIGAEHTSLTQYASGGHGSNPATGTGGTGMSRLTRADDPGSVTLYASANGGYGSAPLAADGSPLPEATATAEAAAERIGRDVAVTANAFGGYGANRICTPGVSCKGADATAHARGTNLGDGFGVRVSAGSVGGIGGNAVGSQKGGHGGDAESIAYGESLGDSAVDVFATAEGGSGGFGGYGVPAVWGDGGRAVATATAVGAGPSRVSASASAYGGLGGNGFSNTHPGALGSASAQSFATGPGEVLAASKASSSLSPAVDSHATSSGPVSHIDTSFQGQGGIVYEFVQSQASERVALARNDVDTSASSLAGGIFVNALPSDSDLATWVEGHPLTQAALAENGHALAVGSLLARSSLDGADAWASFQLAQPADGDVLGFSFLSSESFGNFDVLHVALWFGSEVVLDADFDPATAQAELNDRVLSLAGLDLGSGPIEATLHYQLSFADSAILDTYRSDFLLFVVPEADTGALLLAALLALSLLRAIAPPLAGRGQNVCRWPKGLQLSRK